MKRLMLAFIVFSLTNCTFLPQNNDKGIENVAENKVVTLIQKDGVLGNNALHKTYIQTTLIIDGEMVKRNYFKKQEVIRRYPSPKSIMVKCSYLSGQLGSSNFHSYNGKIEEGKTYIFQCDNMNAVSVKEIDTFDILG